MRNDVSVKENKRIQSCHGDCIDIKNIIWVLIWGLPYRMKQGYLNSSLSKQKKKKSKFVGPLIL
jgi:hypothetical protein